MFRNAFFDKRAQVTEVFWLLRFPTRARAQGWKETLLDFYWATWEIGFSNVLYFNLGGNFRGPEIQFKISNVLIT